MTTIEKIDFIIKTTGWSKKRFTRKFYLKADSLEKWYNGIEPSEKEINNICRYFHLPIKDFLNNNLNIFLRSTEKYCVFSLDEKDISSLEDYSLEDNPRYEEKD